MTMYRMKKHILLLFVLAVLAGCKLCCW
ncbi:lipoprotein [Neisseria musculi]